MMVVRSMSVGSFKTLVTVRSALTKYLDFNQVAGWVRMELASRGVTVDTLKLELDEPEYGSILAIEGVGIRFKMGVDTRASYDETLEEAARVIRETVSSVLAEIKGFGICYLFEIDGKHFVHAYPIESTSKEER